MKYYRFFRNEKRRDEFIKGNVRFEDLKKYRKIEDEVIRDKDEGKAIVKYKTPIRTVIIDPKTKLVHEEFSLGSMNSSGEVPATFFICSLCDENIDPIKKSKEFKKRYAVIINDIGKIHDLLEKNHAYSSFNRKIGKIKLDKAIYNRGDYLFTDDSKRLPIIYPPHNYHFSQKSPEDSDCHEWRFVIKLTPTKNDYKLIKKEEEKLNKKDTKKDDGLYIKIGDISDYVSPKDF